MKNKVLLVISISIIVLAFITGGVMLFAVSQTLAVDEKSVDTKKSDYVKYDFTADQKKLLQKKSAEYKGAALGLKLVLKADGQAGKESSQASENGDLVEFGLICSDEECNGGPVVFNASEVNVQTFTIYRALFAGEQIEGFYLKNGGRFNIEKILLDVKKSGWKKNNGEPVFAFSPYGGSVDFSFETFDFSGSQELVAKGRSRGDFIDPVLKIEFAECTDNGTYDRQRQVNMRYGDEDLVVRRVKGSQKVSLQTECFLNKFTKSQFMVFNDEDEDLVHNEDVTALMMEVNDVSLAASSFDDGLLKPLPTDLGMIADTPKQQWRNDDFELYSWDAMPDVLVFDIKDYRTQELFFARIAFFAEKEGYRGRLVSDQFTRTHHSYNAHDYKCQDLARFFNAVKEQNYPVSKYEKALEKMLVNEGIIAKKSDGTYEGVKGGVISICQESSDSLRRTFTAHEGWHGAYFIDEDFRNAVSAVYLMFDETSMKFLKTFWRYNPNLTYDLSDDYLMQNEFMAYLMQQRLSLVEPYFLDMADSSYVKSNCPSEAKFVKSTDAEAFTQACAVLNEFAFEKWGMAAGRNFLVSR